MTQGTLFVVATPIGNLDDLSPRAARLLGEVDLVAAEDTRRTGRLLRHAGADARQVSLHEHNEDAMVERLVAELAAGRSVALVSDAGTPLISDPGYRLIAAARDAGIEVTPIPGPCAAIAALSVSGLPVDRFCFEGFLPSKKAARDARLDGLRHERRSIVFYEAVHRIRQTLGELADALGADRPAFLGREISKLHEQNLRGTLGGLLDAIRNGQVAEKGEFVIVVQGGSGDAAADPTADVLLRRLLPLLSGKQAVEIVAEVTGEPRNRIYRRMLELREAAD